MSKPKKAESEIKKAHRQFEIDAKPEIDAVVDAAMNWHTAQDIQTKSPNGLRMAETKLYAATRALYSKQMYASAAIMFKLNSKA